MTANAINAMRLQEEKRHNRTQEGEAEKSRKTDFAGNILGATLRGLGTGLLGTVASKLGKARTLNDVVTGNNKQRRQNTNNNRGGTK